MQCRYMVETNRGLKMPAQVNIMRNKTEALLNKRGHTAESASKAINDNFALAFSAAPDAKASWLADFCISVD